MLIQHRKRLNNGQITAKYRKLLLFDILRHRGEAYNYYTFFKFTLYVLFFYKTMCYQKKHKV